MNIGFRSDIRITELYSADADLISLCFSTGSTVSSPKLILDMMYMLNGQFTVEHIKTGSINQKDIESEKALDELLNMGVVHESSTDFDARYTKAKDKLCKYVVHFPRMSNIGVMIAVLLQKMHVKTVFYENREITQSDVTQNIYFTPADIGKNIGSVIQDEMKADVITFVDSAFDKGNLNENVDIVVNADATNWISNGDGITINTWNYKHIKFNDFKLFNGNKGRINVSDDLKPLFDGYILAIRSVDDMLYSVTGDLVF